MITLAEIVAALSGLQSGGNELPDVQISDVTADSRRVAAGALFVAIRGDQHDGHAYLPAAIQAGAAAAVGTATTDELAAQGIALPPGFPYVVAADARTALAEASAALHGFPSRALTVIGVTGTDGKTTTCALLESILAEATRSVSAPHGRVGVITTVAARIAGVEQDTGLHVTTPDAPEVQGYLAQMRDAGCVYAVVESTSHGLAQKRTAAVDYDVAAVTNITHEHLDYHGSREAYVQAKALLFRSLFAPAQKPGVRKIAVLNADDAGSFGALQEVLREETARHGRGVDVLAYGLGLGMADVTASDVVYAPQRTTFRLRWPGGEFDVETALIGEFNVSNILCAASVALQLGIEPDVVRRGVAQMRGVTGRMERIDCGQPFLAIVDFAHSPVSLERALQTLRPLVRPNPDGTPGRLIAVFGCAGLRDRAKRDLMGQVSGRLADFTVITAEDPRTEDLDEINRAIEAGVREHAGADAYCIVPDRAEAIRTAVRQAHPGDVVAAFGKGHERSMCFGTVEQPWSDQAAMIAALDAPAAPEEQPANEARG